MASTPSVGGRAWGLLVACVMVLGGAATPAVGAPEGTEGLTALDLSNGERQWVAQPGRTGGGFIVLGESGRAVYAVQGRCFWEDERRYQRGDSVLVGFDLGSGRESWRVRDVGYSGGSNTPTLGFVPSWVRGSPDGPIPVFSDSKRRLVAISPRTGDREWSVRTNGLEPVAGDHALIALATGPVSTVDARPRRREPVIRAVDRATGEARWTSDLGGKSDSVLAVAFTSESVAVVVGRFESQLNAIESSVDVARLIVLKRSDGTVRSETSLSSALGLPKGSGQRFVLGLIGTERLIFVWSDRTLAALDPRTGERKWGLPDYAWLSSLVPRSDGRPVLFADHFMVTPNGRLIDRTDAVDGRTGGTLWTVPRDHFVVAAEGPTSVVLPRLWHEFGTALVVDTTTGQTRWTHALSDDQSIVAGRNSLFVGGGCPTTGAD